MKINFILTGEGSSDLRLVEHIENILIQNGFDEASGEAPDLGRLVNPPGRTVREKLIAILQYYPDIDAIFVHRDADGTGTAAREQEIALACGGIAGLPTVIPIIPVTMLETWLLADQDAIKRVSGNQNNQGQITCIPGLNRLESTRDTKTLLLEALCEASAAQGGAIGKIQKALL
ncbi:MULTISPECIES: hypothetical protein [unclassified Pseudomonas]|uniref:hypothetical protein n=1 Tax=unclassified Pseudomonas TaxID=196821 RepID=UPI0024481521|nr:MULTISPECIES: hypothetical protein [unclassified Pseudomonas]MDG9925968.1 DUF4276 family protein [Pseudomonas sp. GD04045]MDH0033646.1 DUF4276 family protein [Pseudomonas sp. GD04019]